MRNCLQDNAKPIVIMVKLRLYPGRDAALIKFFKRIPASKRATAVRKILTRSNLDDFEFSALRRERTERQKMTLRTRFSILKRDNFTCRACGRSPLQGDGVRLHVDHIQPIAYGGKTEPDNLQALCQDCNLGKSASAW